MLEEEIIKMVEDSVSERMKKTKEWREKVGAPMTREIEVLNLIMKKENALAILRGDKNVEYRPFSQHYLSRLTDEKIRDFYERNKENNKIVDLEEEYSHWGFLDDLRPVKTIHFHNYTNSWFLDVEVLFNDYCVADDETLGIMNDVYDDHELDELVRKLDNEKAVERPMFYYFAIKKVIDTNLKLE